MPRYRVIADAFMANGSLCLKGATVRHDAWPDLQKLAPADDDARAITEYFRVHRHEAFLPRSPFDARTQKIYLPGQLPSVRGRGFPAAVDEREASPSIPRYKMTSPYGQQFGGKHIPEDAEFAFLGWPEIGMRVEPVNNEAKAVVAYFAEFGSLPHFPVSPYNCFDGSLWLPALGEPASDENRWPFATPAPRGHTPPPWTSTPKVPAPIYNKGRRSKYSHGDDAA